MLVKKNFKVIGKIDRGNGIEEYPIYIKVSYDVNKGDNLEQVNQDVLSDVEDSAKRHFLMVMNVPYYGAKSITEV
jgi:hypothetical protein